METYLQRYEELQQERLRNRRQRASEQFVSPSASVLSDQLNESFDRALDLFPSNRYEQHGTATDSAYMHHYTREPSHDAWHRDDVNESAPHDAVESRDDAFDFAPQAYDRTFDANADADRHNDGEYNTSAAAQHDQLFDDAQTTRLNGATSVASDEFVDAATYLETHQLGGNDDSFEHDVARQTQQSLWPQMSDNGHDSSYSTNGSGRPSDFFEKRSRNLEHVNFALDDEMTDHSAASHLAAAIDAVAAPATRVNDMPPRTTTAAPTIPATSRAAGAAPNARQQMSLSFSDTNTAFSSGYDIHFDNTKQMFTPNSLKYMQDKSSREMLRESDETSESQLDASTHHESFARLKAARATGERSGARVDTATNVSNSNDDNNDELPESVREMQRGPDVIVEALHEIDAFIANAPVRATSAANASGRTRDQRITTSVHDIVREYDLSLETGLPLSRTTDSWGDDPDDELQDDPTAPSSVSSPHMSASATPSDDAFRLHHHSDHYHHFAELEPISEAHFSAASSLLSYAEPSTSLVRVIEENDASFSSAHTGETLPSSSRGQDATEQVSSTAVRDVTQPGARLPAAAAATARREDSSDNINALRSRHTDAMVSTELASDRCDSGIVTKQRASGVRFTSGVHENSSTSNVQTTHSDRNTQTSPEKTTSEQDASEQQRKEKEWNSRSERKHQQMANQSWSRPPPIPPSRQDEEAMRDIRSNGTNATNTMQQHRHADRDIADRMLPVTPTKEGDAADITLTPIQIARRCRRLLCTVGEIMTERIVFVNGSDAVGRICVSLLPLSTGCQQFSVAPAVLELAPRASNSFVVTLTARTAGVAAGIFQFRGVGLDALFSPYEVLIEASVRRQLVIDAFDISRAAPRIDNPVRDREIEELRRSRCINDIEIGPTFVKFERATSRSGTHSVRATSLTLTNNTDTPQPFEITCAHEHLKISPSRGRIPPAAEVTVSLVPLARPVEQRRKRDESAASSMSSAAGSADWTGSLTVSVGDTVSREVSFVLSADVLQCLPPFDTIARSRHQLSSQADSFYYTKKRNRRGLYFHARAVECGSCNVGESHEVPVYICNGSSAPMTVFLQALMDPFTCSYTTTTIEPRKFIEVPVTFTPKVAGKVSTSLFAYSVTDKAVVTLVARGT